jgi:hypothetical protein
MPRDVETPKLQAALASQRAVALENALIALERRIGSLERSAEYWAQEDAVALAQLRPGEPVDEMAR